MVCAALCLSNASKIDPETPRDAYNITSTAWPSEGYDLVFSDEFQAKDLDSNSWEAINSYNFNTGDFEAYVPSAITTKDL